MTAVQDALAALLAAADTVDGLKGYRGDALGKIQLPAVAVGAPTLTWQVYCTDPTEASFPVTLMVPLGEGALDALLALLPTLQAALEENTPAAVTEATPAALDLGNGSVATYQLTVNYPLGAG